MALKHFLLTSLILNQHLLSQLSFVKIQYNWDTVQQLLFFNYCMSAQGCSKQPVLVTHSTPCVSYEVCIIVLWYPLLWYTTCSKMCNWVEIKMRKVNPFIQIWVCDVRVPYESEWIIKINAVPYKVTGLCDVRVLKVVEMTSCVPFKLCFTTADFLC